MSNSKKRKYPSQQRSDGSATGPDPKLFIQAHEADLIHGPQAARSLEATSETGTIGDALIKWTFTGTEDAAKKEIWVDRYYFILIYLVLDQSMNSNTRNTMG